MYEKFEALLKERGVTPYKVGQATGISTATLSSWKKGVYTPKPDKIQKIADYFDVPASWFYGGEQQEVAAGQGRINDTYEKTGEYSTAKIVGDSMYPALHDGDIVKVHHVTDDISPSDFAIVKVNGDEVTCKHVAITPEGILLKAENKDVYQDTFYSVHEVLTLPIVIVGVATEIVSRKL